MVPGLAGMPMGGLGGSINLAAGGGTARRQALTENIPDPAAVQRQKEQFARSLEDQLRKGVEVLAATHKQQTDLLHAQANQEKQRYNIALDQQVKQRELELSQQYNEQLMRLQQAAQAQRAELEQQACGLTLEYQQRKVQEEYNAQQDGIQKQHSEAQSRLNVEIEKLASGLTGISPATLLERVQANVQANVQPLSSYALPQAMQVRPPAPVAMPAPMMRQYVPPPGPALAPPNMGAPMLSYVQNPAVPSGMPPLSYAPSGMPMAPLGMMPSGSYVPSTPMGMMKR